MDTKQKNLVNKKERNSLSHFRISPHWATGDPWKGIPLPVIVALNFVLQFHKRRWVYAIFEIADCDAE